MMSKLDDIEESHQAITGVVQLWYETNKRHPYAWNILLIIIRLPTVNESNFADQLEVHTVLDKTNVFVISGPLIISTMMTLMMSDFVEAH